MTNSFLDITVLPYRSLSKKGFKYLMLCVAAVFFTIGVFFWIIGAWPVFGFLGLDVLLLYYAFKMNYKSGEIFADNKDINSSLHNSGHFCGENGSRSIKSNLSESFISDIFCLASPQ